MHRTLFLLILTSAFLACSQRQTEVKLESSTDECYQRCMQSNMMRAVAAEVIENDCRIVCREQK